jgi:hypothetical protein
LGHWCLDFVCDLVLGIWNLILPYPRVTRPLRGQTN